MTSGAVEPAGRKGYLDWLRGLGVIVMIQGHVMDSWTLPADRQQSAYNWIHFVGGVGGAPLFLFLAGVALALAAGTRACSGRSESEVAALARRRGWQIFGLALLFRVQAWAISGGPLRTLLKVDILNVMGLSMVAAALFWALGRGTRTRTLLLAAAAAACAFVTPVVRASAAVGVLPDPIEWYVRPAAGMTTFTLFPWAGFLLAGAACGALLDASRGPARERTLNLGLAAAGVLTAAAGYAASFLPSIYEQASFWTSSPTFFFVRLGMVIGLVPIAYALNARLAWPRMREFGRASLFVYWIHVELAYGVFSAPLHRNLPLGPAYVAFVLFTLLMFALVRLKPWLQNAIRYVIFAINARLNILPVRSSRRSL